MRIGILTYHCPPNFGAQLQAVSTVGFLKKTGHEVTILNWYAKDLEEMYSHRIPFQQVLCHNSFAQESLPLTDKCQKEEELIASIDGLKLDAIIAGSDALFKYIPLNKYRHFSKRKLRYIFNFSPLSCELLDVWMNGASHSATIARLEEYCLDGSVFGSSKNGAAQREHRGLSFLLHRLFVSREVLEGMYPPLRTKPYLMPYYQFKRWLRLADPRKRKNVIGEIRLMNTTQAGAIDAFDQLLKEIGL